MKRLVLGLLLVGFYVLGLAGHLLRLASGRPIPGLTPDQYYATVQRGALFGFFLFVIPGGLLALFGYRALRAKRRRNAAS